MATKPQRLCLTCNGVHAPGFCARAAAYDRARAHDPARKLYHTARWLALRKIMLATHPLCAECRRQGRVTVATEIDHIKPHKGDLFGFFEIQNLQPLCKPCHSRKTAREDGRWG